MVFKEQLMRPGGLAAIGISNVKHCAMGYVQNQRCFTKLKLKVEEALSTQICIVNTWSGLG